MGGEGRREGERGREGGREGERGREGRIKGGRDRTVEKEIHNNFCHLTHVSLNLMPSKKSTLCE